MRHNFHYKLKILRLPAVQCFVYLTCKYCLKQDEERLGLIASARHTTSSVPLNCMFQRAILTLSASILPDQGTDIINSTASCHLKSKGAIKASPAANKAHCACLYGYLELASSCHVLQSSTTPSCETARLSQKVQSHFCPHPTQPQPTETKTPMSCRHRLAAQRKLHTHGNVLHGRLGLLSSGVAAALDSMSRSSEHACHCQVW